jgi:hypothetical protein
MTQATALLKLISTFELQSATLNDLFSGQQINKSLEKDLKKLKRYYEAAFWKTTDHSEKQQVIDEYELVVSTMSLVKEGEVTAQQAKALLEELHELRELELFVQNLLTTCELLFWLAVATTLLVVGTTIGAPLLACNPLLGFTLALIAVLSSLCAMEAAEECDSEFASSTPIDTQAKREHRVLSFFASSRPAANEASQEQEATLAQKSV